MSWFTAAIISAIGSGIAAFLLKIVAKKELSSEVNVLHSALFSILVLVVGILIFPKPETIHTFALFLMFLGGILAGITGVFKVYALRYIDTTIYFPLFKLVSPLVAIIIGLIVFSEKFTKYEWIGLLLGLFVPLLLINRSENTRQSNLVAGLGLVVLTGVLAACIAAIGKYSVTLFPEILWLVTSAGFGVALGSLILMLKKCSISQFIPYIKSNSSRENIKLALVRSVFINTSFISVTYAYFAGGELGIVYTIGSMYILIPIVLAIIFYNEHWNLQKISAIILSILSLAFLG